MIKFNLIFILINVNNIFINLITLPLNFRYLRWKFLLTIKTPIWPTLSVMIQLLHMSVSYVDSLQKSFFFTFYSISFSFHFRWWTLLDWLTCALLFTRYLFTMTLNMVLYSYTFYLKLNGIKFKFSSTWKLYKWFSKLNVIFFSTWWLKGFV